MQSVVPDVQHVGDLLSKLATYDSQIRRAIGRVIASGQFVLGPEVQQFESSFAAYLSADYCIGLANGTDAIELSLKAMGVRQGNVVATVANAGMYTTTSILAAGAAPIFMDVDSVTKGTTLTEVVRAVSAGARAVVVTHLFGQAIPEIEQIADHCAEKDVPLLEDCAQAHGARINSKFVGTFGDAASFSFYPTKNLGALGDGGAVVTRDADLAEKITLLRQYGWTEKYKTEIRGAKNSRLDEIQAAILSELLPTLETTNQRRREIAARYSTNLDHANVKVPKVGGEDYVAHLYVIQCNQRESLRKHLRDLAIESDVHYPIPDFKQPIFGDQFAELHLPITERLVKEILTLPCYPELTDPQVDRIIDSINGWVP